MSNYLNVRRSLARARSSLLPLIGAGFVPTVVGLALNERLQDSLIALILAAILFAMLMPLAMSIAAPSASHGGKSL